MSGQRAEGPAVPVDDSATMTWGDLVLSYVPLYAPWRVDCMSAERPPVGEPGCCCWYHAVDWATASDLARQLARAAVLVSDEQVPSRALAAMPRDLPRILAEGIGSLFYWPIDATPRQITNGGHRITAMRGQGVEVTLGIHFGTLS